MLDPNRIDGPVRLLAGPGTGKTHALADLYADLVRGGTGRAQILVLTFSTSAAAEIAARLDERLQDSYDQAWISTFHSFCARLLRDHRPDPRRLLLSGFQEWLAMRRVLEGLDPEQLGALAPVRGSEVFAQDLLAFVSLLKQNLVYPAAFALAAETTGTDRLRALAAAYRAYQDRLEAAHLVDFRDLVAGATDLLSVSSGLLEELRARFRYVLVDEFQDVDPAQFELLRLLAPPERRPRVVVAGDPDQSIYGFRGTVPRLLAVEFERVYGGQTVSLEVCRRCPPAVLEAAERLLRRTQRASRPALSAEQPDRAGSLVVAREIRRLLLESAGELRPRDFAILLRSTSTLSAPFEEALRALGLPYEVRGRGALARNEVVRFLLAYLGALAASDDPDALTRVLASSLSGVSPRTFGRLRAEALEEGRRQGKVVRRLMYVLAARDAARWPLPWGGEPPPPEERTLEYLELMSDAEVDALHAALSAYYRLRSRAGRLSLLGLAYSVLVEARVLERLLGLPVSEAERREALSDLRAALDAFAELEAVQERLTGEKPTLALAGGRLESLLARAVDDAQPAAATREAVQVLTVHQAKGLEFEVVFCSGFAHGLFPLPEREHPLLAEADRAWLEQSLEGFRPSWPADAAGHQAEEARLGFVAMTRARRHLYLTYADAYETPAGPSSFLELAQPRGEVRELSRGAALEAGGVLTRGEAETLLAQAGPAAAADRDRLQRLGVDLDFLLDPAAGQPFEPYGPGHNPEHVDPGHFSATAINDYLKCPRIYWYNQHPGLAPASRGVEMERGSFLHRVLEEFHVREPEWRQLEPELQKEWLESTLQQHLTSYLNRVEGVLDRGREERQVRLTLKHYIDFATSRMQLIPRRGTLRTEQKFRLQLNGAQVHGKIDRINDVGAGTCEVVDYKTGRGHSARRDYDSYFGPELHDVQLALYYLACREGTDEEGNPLGLEPRFLSLWYPKEWIRSDMRQVLFAVGQPAGHRDYVERKLEPEDLERGREVVLQAIRGILSGDFTPRPRPVVGTCLSWFGCPHAAVCPYGGTPPE